MIPVIDAAPLFGPDGPARRAADRAVMEAATAVGFMMLTGLEGHVPVGAEARVALLRVFDLDEAAKRRLWRRKFDPSHANVYRGWFPLQDGQPTYKEGIDIGPDILRGTPPGAGDDPLTEPTPLPPEAALPGWRAAAAAYYAGMEALGAALMRAIARGLGLDGHRFDAAFAGGISTLRLIRYPPRPPQAAAGAEALWVEHAGRRRALAGAAHADSGFVTLLAQDGVPGLQARAADGTWVDVPPAEEALTVNFGRLLERWTGGRVKATEHRVLGGAGERRSIPFFYEPRADAVIAPLPLPGAAAFEPFLYGDHLWAAMTRFVEFRGLETLRPPRGAAA